MVITKDLGAVSAYAYAVEQGYQGTEEEFAELMARQATVAEEAAASADAAAESASEAQASAEQAERSAQSISGDVERAEQAATTATGKATEAATSATTANGAAQTATGKAAQTEQSATAAANSASAAATSASNAASSATAAQTAQTAAETAQGKAEDAQAAAEAAAQSVSESAAQIAKNTDNFASAFSASTTYAIGDYCIYQGTLYRFINEHTGAWSASDVEATNVGGEIGDVKSALSETQIYPKVFVPEQSEIIIISGYNINIAGEYQAVTYTSYCIDQDSYFMIEDGAESISMSGKSMYVRFYDKDLNALGNGGQATASSFTVNVLASNNPNLSADAKWVKFGGFYQNLNGATFTNLIGGRFVLTTVAVGDLEDRVGDLEDRDGAYKTITQSDMTDGYIVMSNGVKKATTNYVCIENIPVVPNQKVIMTAKFGGGVNNSGGISGWDAFGNFKQRVFDGPINGNPTDAQMQYENKEITIPDGVYYIAFSSRKDGSLPISLKLTSIDDPSVVVDEAIAKHDIVGMTNGTVFETEVKSSVESVQTVLAASNKQMLTMAVFTDLHHDPKYPNDPMVDMFANIKALNGRLHFDTLMNLGDAIDGQFQTQFVAEGCLAEVVTNMYDVTPKSHSLTGNHDDNVQSTWADRGNLDSGERLTLLELNEILFKGSENEVHNPNHITDYYIDIEEYDIRVICIGMNYTSFVQATQSWLENTALDTDKPVLVFSHCATKPEWGYNNDISNGSYVETPLNNFVSNGGTVIAFIHGHTHGDMIETDSSIQFTEIAIGCAKFETPTNGTTGITYQPRNSDDYTKILFDIVCVDQTNRKVHFIRCGAGSDRVISY